MLIKWKYFLTKRRLTPSAFIAARDISSYESLVAHLNSLGVEVPPFDEVNHLFSKVRSQTQLVASKAEKPHSLSSVTTVSQVDAENSNVGTPTSHAVNETVFSGSSAVTSDAKPQPKTKESKKRRRADKLQSVKTTDPGSSDADSQE